MDDLLREFLTESNESLATLDQELVKLERNPNDPGLLSHIFRLVHTVKGTCGFLGLPRLERTAHAGENVLGKLRDGELEVTPVAVSLILESLDRIKFLLGALEATGTEPEGNDEELTARLNAFAEGKADPAAAPAAVPAAEAPAPVAAAPVIAAAPVAVETPAQVESVAPAPVASAVAAPAAAPAPVAEAKESAVAAQSIRVNVDTLEHLMTMVSRAGAHPQPAARDRAARGERVQGAAAAPLHVTAELQEGVMKTRMQPIGNAWQKLPRIVRDLARNSARRSSWRCSAPTPSSTARCSS
jgi:two-component system, chemotaxis family, sensor kinase CheA